MMTRRPARCAITLAAATVLLGSCREAPTPFESVDQDEHDLSAPVQLTFNTGTDQMPVWSVDGDSIYYTGAGFIGLPSESRGVLLSVSPEHGPASVLLPELQSNVHIERWLTSPAISRDGQFLAFVELYPLATPTNCSVQCAGPAGPRLALEAFPELDSLQIRVFSTATRTVVAETTVRFMDRTFDPTRPVPGVSGTWVFDMHPYQARWAAERVAIFRPSWSPDGDRLVFSDGNQLMLWSIGQSPQPIPNTPDAMLPAWSPDGQTIAYTRAERGQILRSTCNCLSPRGQISEVQDRILYTGSLGDGTLTLISADGSNSRELGSGDAPAWTPDGQLVFRRAGMLYRSAADGSNAASIPGTFDGHVPAVSPDGRLVAFSRDLEKGTSFDIWVAPLAGAQ